MKEWVKKHPKWTTVIIVELLTIIVSVVGYRPFLKLVERGQGFALATNDKLTLFFGILIQVTIILWILFLLLYIPYRLAKWMWRSTHGKIILVLSIILFAGTATWVGFWIKKHWDPPMQEAQQQSATSTNQR